MNRRRLEMTAALLERLAEKPNPDLGFDLETWHCGAAACAIGHAMLDPAHNAAGLRADADMEPTCGHEFGFSAVHAFYDITPSTALHLFYAGMYSDNEHNSPAAVAARIRELLASEETAR